MYDRKDLTRLLDEARIDLKPEKLATYEDYNASVLTSIAKSLLVIATKLLDS